MSDRQGPQGQHVKDRYAVRVVFHNQAVQFTAETPSKPHFHWVILLARCPGQEVPA